MLGLTRVRRLLDNALNHSDAPQTEVVLEAADAALTRFANNSIHQNVAETDVSIEVRAAYGRRVGSASGNDLSPAGIERLVEAAGASARHQPENAEFPGLPEPSPAPQVHAWDDAAAGATPEARARAVSTIVRHAARAGLGAYGAYSTASSEFAVANSNGVFAYHPSTQVELTLVARDEQASGYAHRIGWQLAQVDAEALCLEAIERALLNRSPRPLTPDVYPVVLDVYAVSSILEALAESGMGALAVQEGRSWMNGRLGRAALSPLISIWDDGLDPHGCPAPFDCEGVPKRRVDIVRAGVPRHPVYDTHTAAREPERRSTGHAQPYDDDDWDGPMPENLCLAPGEASVAQMIESMGRGLYITRLHYTNLVSERNCGLTGTTRDGTWWIEDGQIAYPVQTLRFDQQIVPALRAVRAVGDELRTLAGGVGTHRVPALALESFRCVEAGAAPAAARVESP